MFAWMRRFSPKAAATAVWLGLKGVFAGVLLIPAGYWVAGAVASAVIAGITAFLGYMHHDTWDAGGDAASRRGGEIEMTTLPKPGGVLPGRLIPADGDRGLDQPEQPGRLRPADDDPKRKQRPLGHAELRFHGNVDMRQLRYSVVYHPADPDDPDEAAYLHHVRRNSEMLAFVPAQEIESWPLQFPWHHTGPRRLCVRGIRLSAREPTCEGVIRIAPQRTTKRAATTKVHIVLTPTPPQGAPGEEEMVEGLSTTIAAARQIRLREVFFITLHTMSRSGEVVYLVERDEQAPDQLTARRIDPLGGFSSFTLPHQAEGIELAHDGSRLYLSTAHELYEWRGEAQMPNPIVDTSTTRRTWLAGMGVIDAGVCLVFAAGDEPPVLRCRRQASTTWTGAATLRPVPRRYGVAGDFRYSVGSLGNSLVLVPNALDSGGPIRVAYLPDASQDIARLKQAELSMQASSPSRAVAGVQPLLRQPGLDMYLLYGDFPQTHGAYSVLTVHDVPGPGIAYLSLGLPFGQLPPAQLLRGNADAWVGPAQAGLRVFGLTGSVTSQYYSLPQRKSLATRRLDEPPLWCPGGAVRLIDREQGARMLVVGGWQSTGDSTYPALMTYRVDNYLADPVPELVLELPFGRPRRDLLRSTYSINHITGDAMLLTPVPIGGGQG